MIKAVFKSGKYPTSLVYQTWVLLTRIWVNSYRDLGIYWVRVVMYLMMALLLGSNYSYLANTEQVRIQDRISVLFFSVAFLCFMSVAAIPAFIQERLIFERERASGTYRVSSYVLANTLIGLPFVLLITLTFTTVAYWWVPLNEDGPARFFWFLLILYTALYVAESMMILISAIVPYFIIALAIGSFANGFFMLVQGYFLRKDHIVRGWIWGHYISYQKYSFEAMLKNEFRSNYVYNCDTTVQPCFCFYQPSNQSACTFTGPDILREYGYQDVSIINWWGVLVGMIGCLRIMFYIILRCKAKKR